MKLSYESADCKIMERNYMYSINVRRVYELALLKAIENWTMKREHYEKYVTDFNREAMVAAYIEMNDVMYLFSESIKRGEE